MRTTKYALVICLLFIALSVPVLADQTTYTINFTTATGPAPTGSFTYDSTTPTFSNFIVTWDGIPFDLTSSANAPINHSSGCTGEASTPAYGFALLSQNLACLSTPVYSWVAEPRAGPTAFFHFIALEPPLQSNLYDAVGVSVSTTGSVPFADGTWTISARSVPEPPESLLIATGLLGLVVARRKLRLA